MFDLEISKAVNNEINHIWGTFGANYGAAPGYGLIGISIAVLAGCLHGYSKKQKIPALIIIFVGIMVFLIGIVDNDQEWMINGASLAISLTIFVVITLNKDYKEFLHPFLLLGKKYESWSQSKPIPIMLSFESVIKMVSCGSSSPSLLRYK